MSKQNTTPRSDAFHGVPTFFRCCCAEASQGGRNSYAWAAWHLISAVGSLAPYDLSRDAWGDLVDEVRELARRQDVAGVLRWLDRHYPKCMEVVPRRRRLVFARGVFRAYEDDRIWI